MLDYNIDGREIIEMNLLGSRTVLMDVKKFYHKNYSPLHIDTFALNEYQLSWYCK